MSPLRGRLAALPAGRVDAALAALMVIELELELWLTHQPPWLAQQRPLQSIAAVLYGAAIAVRRRSPAGGLLFLAAVALIQALAGAYLIDSIVGTIVPPAVLAYSVGSRLELRTAARTLLVAFTMLAGSTLASDAIVPPRGHGSFGTDLVVDAALLMIGPWLAGRLARERTRRSVAFRDLAAVAVAEREQRARAAIAEERIRIGGELQDIIAHSVSAMVIGAGGARWLLHSDPARARESMLTVEETGREALADLRRLLGMLRKDADPRALAPQPGLQQLPALIAAAGFRCELITEGGPAPLTPGIDLVGYRIAEAALAVLAANGATAAAVAIDYSPDWLVIEVRSGTSIPGAERELEPIVERVALYDGALAVSSDLGFRLSARLPLAVGVRA
jgi:signal transduction histidine kinase